MEGGVGRDARNHGAERVQKVGSESIDLHKVFEFFDIEAKTKFLILLGERKLVYYRKCA